MDDQPDLIREGDHIEFSWKDSRDNVGIATGTVNILWPDGREYGTEDPVAEIFLDGGCYTVVPVKDLRRTS